MRILHAANYHMDKDGERYFSWDQKMHQGLVQAGHYVYPFSISDRARMLSPLCSKTGSQRQTNRRLIRTCENLQPHLLLLGHAKFILPRTVETIRQRFPDTKIALYFGDAIWPGAPVEHLQSMLPFLDAVFISTGGELLKPYCGISRPAAFIPNSIEPSIECHCAFEVRDPEYDLVFFGHDRGIPARREFLQRLVTALPELRFGIFGSLGNPGVFGFQRDEILAHSRMALNLTRMDDVTMCSSDRIAQTTGNGVLTLTHAGAGLQALYGPDEIVYFRDLGDLIEKCRKLKVDDQEWRRIARNGWRKSHACYSSREVARFIVNLTFRDDAWREAAWSEHVYWAGPAQSAHEAHRFAA